MFSKTGLKRRIRRRSAALFDPAEDPAHTETGQESKSKAHIIPYTALSRMTKPEKIFFCSNAPTARIRKPVTGYGDVQKDGQ